MTQDLSTRELTRADLPAVAVVLDESGLFPSALLADIAAPFLDGSSSDLWLVICDREKLLGFIFCEPERLTDRTYNLLAIAVLPASQGRGVGKALVAALEHRLIGIGGRVLIVETSSLDEYEPTRRFYDGLGFVREARIRDFYADGEDKFVFWRKLPAIASLPALPDAVGLTSRSCA